jgi:hypothetical protein
MILHINGSCYDISSLEDYMIHVVIKFVVVNFTMAFDQEYL